MQINKYRMSKKIKYKDIDSLYVELAEVVGLKVLKFIRENDISTGDMMYLDIRLLLEKKDEKINEL